MHKTKRGEDVFFRIHKLPSSCGYFVKTQLFDKNVKLLKCPQITYTHIETIFLITQ